MSTAELDWAPLVVVLTINSLETAIPVAAKRRAITASPLPSCDALVQVTTNSPVAVIATLGML